MKTKAVLAACLFGLICGFCPAQENTDAQAIEQFHKDIREAFRTLRLHYENKNDIVERQRINKYAVNSRKFSSLFLDGNRADKILNLTVEDRTFRSKDFSIGNLSFDRGKFATTITGQVFNNSTKDYKAASFDLNVFDKNSKLVGTSKIYLNNFQYLATKSFKGVFRGKMPKDAKYELEFDYGR